MKLKTLAVVCALGCLGMAPQAFARVFDVTFQGEVSGFSGADNLFGLTSGDSGEFITGLFTYDTSLGERTNFYGDDALEGEIGGPSIPVTGVTLTSGGQSYSFTPDASGSVVADTQKDVLGVPGLSYGAETIAGDNFVLVFAPNGASPETVDTPFSGVGQSYGGSLLTASGDTVSFDVGFLAVAGAPEPSTWALFTLGVGVAGLALRSRHSQAKPELTAPAT